MEWRSPETCANKGKKKNSKKKTHSLHTCDEGSADVKGGSEDQRVTLSLESDMNDQLTSKLPLRAGDCIFQRTEASSSPTEADSMSAVCPAPFRGKLGESRPQAQVPSRTHEEPVSKRGDTSAPAGADGDGTSVLANIAEASETDKSAMMDTRAHLLAISDDSVSAVAPECGTPAETYGMSLAEVTNDNLLGSTDAFTEKSAVPVYQNVFDKIW
jgi:hypothetical protein